MRLFLVSRHLSLVTLNLAIGIRGRRSGRGWFLVLACRELRRRGAGFWLSSLPQLVVQAPDHAHPRGMPGGTLGAGLTHQNQLPQSCAQLFVRVSRRLIVHLLWLRDIDDTSCGGGEMESIGISILLSYLTFPAIQSSSAHRWVWCEIDGSASGAKKPMSAASSPGARAAMSSQWAR